MGKMIPILTSIFFKWGWFSHQPVMEFVLFFFVVSGVFFRAKPGFDDFWSFSPRPSWVLCRSDSDGGWRILFLVDRDVFWNKDVVRVEGKTFEELVEETANLLCKFDAKIELLKKDVFLNSMMESGSTDFDVFLRGHALRNQFNGYYRSGSVGQLTWTLGCYREDEDTPHLQSHPRI